MWSVLARIFPRLISLTSQVMTSPLIMVMISVLGTAAAGPAHKAITRQRTASEISRSKNGELEFDFTRYATFVNLSLGLAVFFLSRVLAVLYFMNSIDHENIIKRARKKLVTNAVPFLVFFLFFVVNLLLMDGYAVDPESKIVSLEAYKYLHNLLAMPVVLIIFLLGVVAVLLGIARPLMAFEKCHTKGIWCAGIGTILTVFALTVEPVDPSPCLKSAPVAQGTLGRG